MPRPAEPDASRDDAALATTMGASSDASTLVSSHAETAVMGVGAKHPSSPAGVDVAPAPLQESGFDARYELRALIGEGGMGEVRVAKDRRVGREVALKSIREGAGSRSDARVRFEREARVQGQLEHPSVVPVYDLGITPAGAAFFTMKRVRGKTLEEIVAGLRADTEDAAAYGRRRLLTAFSSVCLAVAFAHARGVLHRDLKPGNIMLGAFGELYVLDWGLAKVTGTADITLSEVVDSSSETEAKTVAGAILGTPGYMAPEQIRGEVAELDERCDVYALGAILFELLALEPLHKRSGGINAIYSATLTGSDASPSRRAPGREVPPELDAICTRATALRPEDRYASARELGEAVERFLDGDRDLTYRGELADRHAGAAEATLGELANAKNPGEVRARALRELGSALALDPRHPGAIAAMLKLLLDAPAEMPAEARAEFESNVAANELKAKRTSYVAYVIYAALSPALLLLGIRNVSLFVALCVVAAIVPVIAAIAMRYGNDRNKQLSVVLASSVAIACASFFVGPLVVVPSVAVANTLAFVIFGKRELRPLVVLTGIASVTIPLALELAGVLPRPYLFTPSGMTIVPQVSELPELGTLAYLTAIHVALILGTTSILARIRDSLNASEERLFMQAWNLRQLVPTEARATSEPAEQPACGASAERPPKKARA